MQKHLKVLVGVPSGPLWASEFGMCLGNLMATFANVRVPGVVSQELRVANVRSSVLPRNRLDLVKMAKSAGVDYLLMMDCDHTFPADILHKMLKHDKPVVAINCVTKCIPAQTTARQKSADGLGTPVFSDNNAGLERVWRVGTGIMLIRRDVLEQVPHSAWTMVYKEDVDSYQGEDWSFCQACEELGIPLYVDHGLSVKVGHVGNLTYTHDLVGEVVRVPEAA